MRQSRLAINAQWKRLSVILIPALLLSIAVGCKQGQVATAVEADIWNVDQLPAKFCKPDSPLWGEGIYRKITCVKGSTQQECKDGAKDYEEFISYCDPAVKKYSAMHADDKKEWAAWVSEHCK